MDEAMQAFRAGLDERPVSRFQWRLLVLVVLVLIADGYDMQSAGYVAPVVTADWRLAKGAFGPIFSVGLVGYMLGAMIFSSLADRFGARRILIACTGAFGLFSLMTAAAAGPAALMAGRFAAGVALGGAMPNCIALMSDYAPARQRTLLVTIAACGFSIGGAFGGVAAALLLQASGWRAVFALGGLAPLALLPCLALWLPESPGRLLSHPASRQRLLKTLERIAPGWVMPDQAATVQAARPAPVVGLFAGGLALSTLLIWSVFFLNLLTLYTLSSWLPSLIKDAGLPIGAANLATALFQAVGAVGALGLAWFSDRFKAQWVMAVAFLIAAAAVFLLSGAGASAGLIFAGAALAGLGVIGGQNAANGFVSGYYPGVVKASGIGWALGVGRLGSILGPLLVGGLIASGVGPETLFKLCVIPTLGAAALITLVPARRGMDRPPA